MSECRAAVTSWARSRLDERLDERRISLLEGRGLILEKDNGAAAVQIHEPPRSLSFCCSVPAIVVQWPERLYCLLNGGDSLLPAQCSCSSLCTTTGCSVAAHLRRLLGLIWGRARRLQAARLLIYEHEAAVGKALCRQHHGGYLAGLPLLTATCQLHTCAAQASVPPALRSRLSSLRWTLHGLSKHTLALKGVCD